MWKTGFRILSFYSISVVAILGFALIQPILDWFVEPFIGILTHKFTANQVEIFEVIVAVVLVWYAIPVLWRISGWYFESVRETPEDPKITLDPNDPIIGGK